MNRGDQTTKPVGGFRLMTPFQVAAVWTAYKSKGVRGFSYFDFRVYLALHEVQERRDAGSRAGNRRSGGACRYDLVRLVDEVHGLVGGAGGRRIRASFRRLKLSGLVSFGPTRIKFASLLDDLPVVLRRDVEVMLDRIPNRNRRVPVSRGTLRFIVREAAAATAGVMLGQVLRCVYLRGKSYRCEGSCSTRFIEDTFGIHARTVKRVRGPKGVLRRIGWLVPVVADHWHVQRHGARMVVNPAWRRSTTVDRPAAVRRVVRNTPPRTAACDTGLPPPESNRHLPSGSRNQQPAGRGPSGVWRAGLSDGEQVMRLYRQAVERGLMRDSESARLRFFGAAERAKRRASQNETGFLWTVVRRGLWHFITQDEEDAARRTLGALDRRQRRAEDERRPSALGGWTGSAAVVSLVADLASKRSLPNRSAKISCTTSCTTIPGRLALQRGKNDPR